MVLQREKKLPPTKCNFDNANYFDCFVAFRGRLLGTEYPWILIYVSVVFAYVLINYIAVGLKSPGIFAKSRCWCFCCSVSLFFTWLCVLFNTEIFQYLLGRVDKV